MKSSLCVAACLLAALPLCAAAAAPPDPVPNVVPDVRTDARALDEIARQARALPIGGRLTVTGVELGAGASLDILDLERFQLFSDGATIVVHGEEGDEVLAPPENVWLRGRVAGDPASRVLLTVRAGGGVRGLVESEGRTWVLAGDDGEGTRQPRLRAERAASGTQAKPFVCGNEDLDFAAPGGAPLDALTGALEAAGGALTTTPYTARLAIETDWEYYQLFGNATEATDYVGDVVGFASTMYDDEIDTDLQISHLSLWTTSGDPWTESGSTCRWLQFGRYWNDNRDAVERTIAHFMSGQNTGSGIAWVGVLCEGDFNVNHGGSCAGLSPNVDNYGGGYGYTGGIDGDFDPDNPLPLWDIVAVSHEIGHNFNSPHTHCYNGLGGSSQPVDECYNGQAGQGCYAGSQSLPCATPGAGCGTIMSYCHLLFPGETNIAFSFGTGHPFGTLPQRVPDRMRAHVEATVASDPACLARIDPCTEDLVLSGQTITTTETYEVCGTITAHDGFVVGGSGDVTMIAGERVVLGDGFRVELNGKLVVAVQ